jgi:predicted XRE-type DNA-binding protein
MAQVQTPALRTPSRRLRRPPADQVPRVTSKVPLTPDHASSPKHRLASQINRLLDEQKLSQLAASKRLGISQPKISAIRNYKLHGISLGRLMETLVALDQRVTIVIRPRTAHCREPISVLP